MYFSKIEFIPSQWQRMVRVLNQVLFQEHQMIWNLLPADAQATRDFLYRRDDSQAVPFYYLLSKRRPLESSDLLTCKTLRYQPQLVVGERLQFDLRVNAVKTYKETSGVKQRKRRDIVEAKVDFFKAQFSNPQERPSSDWIRYTAAQEWLSYQGQKGGFTLTTLSVDNWQAHTVIKPQDPNRRRLTSLDIKGELQVTDVESFETLLFSGLGRAKAFGCGLLLIKRV